MTPRWSFPQTEDVFDTYMWGGLCVGSNLPLPRLMPANECAELRFRWRFEAPPALQTAPPITQIITRAGNLLTVRLSSEGWTRYEIDQAGVYDVRPHERLIDLFPSPDAEPMWVEHFLVNAVLPIYIAWDDAVICLHASAVARKGRAVVFAGPSGSGKSSRAGHEIVEGASLMADDAVVLREQASMWHVYPGSRTLRVADAPVSNSWQSGVKRETFPSFQQGPLPLERLVLLGSSGQPVAAKSQAELYRSLLSLQAGWTWANQAARAAVATRTWRLTRRLVSMRVDLSDPRSQRDHGADVSEGAARPAGSVPDAAQRLQDGRLV
jgi:hypothetical protein